MVLLVRVAWLPGAARFGAVIEEVKMNHNVTQGAGGPLARIGRRVAAIVAECNYAATRVASLRSTPEFF